MQVKVKQTNICNKLSKPSQPTSNNHLNFLKSENIDINVETAAVSVFRMAANSRDKNL